METVLLFACVLIAVVLGGSNVLGFLLALAACQFVGSLVWFIVSCRPKHGY